jgi:hypothetical protein
MKFKKMLGAAAVSSAFVAASAVAGPVVINVNGFDTTPAVDVNQPGFPPTDGKTVPITALALNWSATSTYTDSNGNGLVDFGDSVVDSGNGSVSSYLGAGNAAITGVEESEGLGTFHSMLFSYSNLSGKVVANDLNGGIGAIYSSGTINVFGNGLQGAANVLLMTLDVTGSTGTIGNFSLFTKVASVNKPNVFFYNGKAFEDFISDMQIIVAEANFNTKPLVPTSLGGTPQMWNRTTTLNGNLVFDVPEPGMLALLGLGLVGIGFARRNKKQA